MLHFFSRQRECETLHNRLNALRKSYAFIEIDSDSVITDVTDRVCDQLRYVRHELVGFPLEKVLCCDSMVLRYTELKQCEQSQREEIALWPHGRDGIFGAKVSSFLSGDEPRLILSLDFDTKNRLDLESSKNTIESLSSSLSVIEFESNGRILNANDGFLSAVGYDITELSKMTYHQLIDDSFLFEDHYQKLIDSIEADGCVDSEVCCKHKDGRPVWFKSRYTISDQKRKPVDGFILFNAAIEITREKKYIDENKELKKYISAIQQSSKPCVLIDENFNVTCINEQALTLFQDCKGSVRTESISFDPSSLIGTDIRDWCSVIAQNVRSIGASKQVFSRTWVISDCTLDMSMSHWQGDDGEPLGYIIHWEDITDRCVREQKEKEINESNLLILNGMDRLKASVMIADVDSNIVYANGSVKEIMKSAERDIKKELPNFNADCFVGENVDVFHKDPSHQRNILRHLKETYYGSAEVGGRYFDVIATPVFNEKNRLGTVVEWADKTSEKKIESEFDNVVEAAISGDFTCQVSLEDKHDFTKKLAVGLNTLTSTFEVAINDIARILGAMARGDLSERITREYAGAFGELKKSANTSTEKLTEIINNILTSSNAITMTAKEIEQGNLDLSHRTEDQANSLRETAANMGAMNSAVKQSAEYAELANERASEAQAKAKQGGDVVEKAINAMNEINSASKKISDIIGVIDEIAFQTNLLALNAAVEAARAGEQGRGFAVVAGEVRNLAQRSASAAREIKGLIKDSVNKVEDGAALVNRSGGMLNEIVAAVENVTTMMSEIAGAAKEQTNGIDQVNSAVARMDEITQKNAALVEEAAASGESMSNKAVEMNKVVSFFNAGVTALVSQTPSSKPVSKSIKTVAQSPIRTTPQAPKTSQTQTPTYKSAGVTNKPLNKQRRDPEQRAPGGLPQRQLATPKRQDHSILLGEDDWEDF